MMNTKTATITVMAIVLGYSIISVVPSIFTSYVPPYQNNTLDKGEDMLQDPSFEGSGDRNSEDSTLETATIQNINYNQIKYIVIDLSIAFLIYYIARKKLV